MTKRILVVDDDEALLETLSVFLRKKGFEVQTANTVEAAASAASKASFDLVLLDLKIGNRSGEEFLAIIDMFLLSAPKKIIVMTGFAGKFDIAKIKGQVAAVLEKPFTFEALMAEIQK